MWYCIHIEQFSENTILKYLILRILEETKSFLEIGNKLQNIFVLIRYIEMKFYHECSVQMFFNNKTVHWKMGSWVYHALNLNFIAYSNTHLQFFYHILVLICFYLRGNEIHMTSIYRTIKYVILTTVCWRTSNYITL